MVHSIRRRSVLLSQRGASTRGIFGRTVETCSIRGHVCVCVRVVCHVLRLSPGPLRCRIEGVQKTYFGIKRRAPFSRQKERPDETSLASRVVREKKKAGHDGKCGVGGRLRGFGRRLRLRDFDGVWQTARGPERRVRGVRPGRGHGDVDLGASLVGPVRDRVRDPRRASRSSSSGVDRELFLDSLARIAARVLPAPKRPFVAFASLALVRPSPRRPPVSLESAFARRDFLLPPASRVTGPPRRLRSPPSPSRPTSSTSAAGE